MKIIRYFVALFLSLCLVSGASCVWAEDGRANRCEPIFHVVKSFTCEELPLYTRDLENESLMNVYYINGEKGIPYLSLEDCARIYNTMMEVFQSESQIRFEWEDSQGVLVRDNGCRVILDAEANTITFPDAGLFYTSSNSVQRLDLVDTYKKDGKTYLIDHKPISERIGLPEVYDLDHYGIRLLQWDGVLYIPLQTFSDLFIARVGISLMYNGKMLFCGEATQTSKANGTDKELAERFKDAADVERTPELIQFNYNELCMVLDSFYGLAEEHNIDNFADFFVQTGLVDDFFSNSTMDTYMALSKLTLSYFGDKHSAVADYSPYVDLQNDVQANLQILSSMITLQDTLDSMSKYSSFRSAYYPNGPVGYEEVGNTAYITFDSFVMDTEKDYYSSEIINDTSDTITLLLYANQQLHRKDCPIENVVIDLTNNVGGMADVAVCVVSWFLGRCNLYIQDMKNGGQSCTQYLFDANLDGLFNESFDYVRNYKLYCLISPNSFSCGNLVPAAFAASDEVFLIGRKSGGGACAVLTLTDAVGDIFTISSPYRINTSVNGSYISVDQGVEPDLVISDPAKLYDRAYMTELINKLP